MVADEPSAEAFKVIDVDDQRGQGILVLRAFQRGEILFRMNGQLTKQMTLHSLQVGPELHLDDPWFAGKTLHSCDPNSELEVETLLFTAVRDILPGELLTMDYDHTEDVLFRAFECHCGGPSCRGYVGGRKVSVPAASNK
ncbi:hypothetical protein Pla111_00390 [Botrimarina hoheduenensis]|uniref:Post-SET domain-containing protein n=2 Tax=Botrimarina hoheduenensis TaxID=2528000 RepID=A0A5C5WBK0_9BACT|nr:hypothetical protein Pla111_00390 [Botrimarina hoheduenensis]